MRHPLKHKPYMSINSLRWVWAFFFCFTCPVNALDDSNWDPLVTITFPLDTKSESDFGHVVVEYVLYPSGYCTNEINVFGGDGKLNSSDSAWLSQSHVDAVLKLVSKISSSTAKPKSSVNAILLRGTVTGNKLISRDYRANITDVRSLLRLLGGVRGDLEEHFKG